MISWVSYTTAKVSNTFQGSVQGSAKAASSRTVLTNCQTFTTSIITITSPSGNTTFMGGGTVTECETGTSSNSNSNTFNRFGTTNGNAIVQVNKNSTIFQYVTQDIYGNTGTSSSIETSPKQKITQFTTSTKSITANVITTSQGTRWSFPWTTQTIGTNSSQTKSFTFFITGKTANSVIQVQSNTTREQTFLTSKETIEFVTYTDLPEDQVVVAHTIYEDSKGFYFYSAGALIDKINYTEQEEYNSGNTGWSAVTAGSVSSATRITVSYSPIYVELPTAETISGFSQPLITTTIYDLFNFAYQKTTDEFGETEISQVPFSTVKTVVQSNVFPFITSNAPEGWDSIEGGEYGRIIYNFGVLESVETSKTQIIYPSYQSSFDNSGSSVFFNNDGEPSATFITANGYTRAGKWYEISNNKLNIKQPQNIFHAFPLFFTNCFGEADLFFSKTSYAETPLFLKLDVAQITLNDLPESLINLGVFRDSFKKLETPFAFPSFTAYAKPTILYTEDSESFTVYDTEESKWTSVTVSRTGRTFSSFWEWKINSTLQSSSSGTAKLVEEIQIPTYVGFYDHAFANIRGGANFPHRSFTIQKTPYIVHKTIYDATESSTQSEAQLPFSVATTVTSFGNDKITISSYLPLIKGAGILFTNWPYEVI
jgi:hypothetical protein